MAVSAQPVSKASSTSDSVTIPLILRQPADAKPPPEPKKTAPPPKVEPKSPQDILAAPTPMAMQSIEPPVTVPTIEPPPAPTLDPTLPTNPELFVPDLTTPLPPPKPQIAEPKPPKKLVPAAAPQPASTVAEPKKLVPAPVAQPEPKAQAALGSGPKYPAPMPREKPRAATMEPVDDVKPSSLRKARDANPPALVPQGSQEAPAAPRTVEMQPADEPSALRAAPDGKPPSFRCFVRDVMAFSDRTHVRCRNNVQGVSYFAVNTDQPVAETVVTKALAAMKSGKPITIAFAPDVDLNPPNCGGKDCRRLIDIEN